MASEGLCSAPSLEHLPSHQEKILLLQTILASCLTRFFPSSFQNFALKFCSFGLINFNAFIEIQKVGFQMIPAVAKSSNRPMFFIIMPICVEVERFSLQFVSVCVVVAVAVARVSFDVRVLPATTLNSRIKVVFDVALIMTNRQTHAYYFSLIFYKPEIRCFIAKLVYKIWFFPYILNKFTARLAQRLLDCWIINLIRMEGEGDQNIVKSIIYGNLVQTSIGIMRALCSAIASKDHIDKIILFLKNSHNFQKYNRLIYAFRLEQQPNHLFITENSQPPLKFLEGYNDDSGLEGNGEKLLSLLQKFNVRNVLVIVALRQKDSLGEFNSEHCMQIVKCAKDLLSSLYDKVVLSRAEEQSQSLQEGEKIALQPKQYVIPLEQFQKSQKPLANPNYVGLQHVRGLGEQSLKNEKSPTISFLDSKIKELAGVLEDIIERFGENEDAQAKFAIKYDKNKRVGKVFSLMAKLFDLKKKEDLLSDSMSSYLKSITNRNLTPGTIRSLNEELMSDRSLRAEIIGGENRVCGMLMEFLEVLLKSYSFAKKLAMIESELQEKDEKEEEDANEEEAWPLSQ